MVPIFNISEKGYILVTNPEILKIMQYASPIELYNKSQAVVLLENIGVATFFLDICFAYDRIDSNIFIWGMGA